MSDSTMASRAAVELRDVKGKLERRFGRKSVLWGTLAVGFVALVLLVRGLAIKKPEKPAPPPRAVETAKVFQKDVPLYLDEIGTCAAYETVQVQSQVSGKILERHFEDGAEVKKGDLLFTIDPRPFQAALEQARGQLGQAQSQLTLDQITLKRQGELRSRSVTSPQEFDIAQGTVNSDLAKVKSAEAAVASAEVNVDYSIIRSPIDGRVGIRNVDIGNVVGPGSATPLVTIQRLDPIYTDFSIAEPDVSLVRRYLNGKKLEVLTDSEDDDAPPRSGELSFIDNAVQPGSGTVKARGVTPNPDRTFWPSQFVRVRLILETLKGAKLVPSGAVQIGQNGPFVFVVKPDSTLDLRQVKSGQRQGAFTVVTEGVEAGERVVVSGQLQLAPGAKVTAKELNPGGGGADSRERSGTSSAR